jgi:hypothetical protein
MAASFASGRFWIEPDTGGGDEGGGDAWSRT